MSQPSSTILVCLPTFREEQSIEKMIDQIGALGYPLVVTDGGSDDQTVLLARKKGIVVLLRPGLGKGAGIKQALEYAVAQSFEGICFLDCDLTYPVSSIPLLESVFNEGCDMVSGARPFKKIVFLNRCANVLFTSAINILFKGRLKDTQTGMRILRTSSFNGKLTASGFDVESEINCLALKLKMEIREVDIDYHERVGESKVSIWDAFVILRRIMLERFR
jgi:glycosyltransferase involved in cell wall biosynthesis